MSNYKINNVFQPKNLIIIILLFNVYSINAQTFGGIYTSGYETQKYIEKDLNKQIKKGQKKNEIDSSYKKINGDTLIYVIQHKTDPFTIKMIFNIKDSLLEEDYCGIQEYIFDCTPCSEKHLKEFIDNNNFLKVAENNYMSPYYLKTKMIVSYRAGNKNCVIVTFKNLEMPKKKYKELYQSLNKNKT